MKDVADTGQGSPRAGRQTAESRGKVAQRRLLVAWAHLGLGGSSLLIQAERARPLGPSYNTAPSLEESPSVSQRTQNVPCSYWSTSSFGEPGRNLHFRHSGTEQEPLASSHPVTNLWPLAWPQPLLQPGCLCSLRSLPPLSS